MQANIDIIIKGMFLSANIKSSLINNKYCYKQCMGMHAVQWPLTRSQAHVCNNLKGHLYRPLIHNPSSSKVQIMYECVWTLPRSRHSCINEPHCRLIAWNILTDLSPWSCDVHELCPNLPNSWLEQWHPYLELLAMIKHISQQLQSLHV